MLYVIKRLYTGSSRSGKKWSISLYDCEDIEAVIDELGAEDLDPDGYVINHTNSRFRAKPVEENDKDLTGYCCCLLIIFIGVLVLLFGHQ